MEHWTICDLGHVHWGNAGGAGFLFRHTPEEGDPSFLLSQRSNAVDNPGTWGIPGGALRDGESPETGARREFNEEIGRLPTYRVAETRVQDCGGNWKFHIILADVDQQFPAYCGTETDATGWFTEGDMSHLHLHPGLELWFRERDHS